MAFTADEEARISRIEEAITKIQIALQNLSSKRQLNQLLAVLQKENSDLKAQVEALQSQVDLLKVSR